MVQSFSRFPINGDIIQYEYHIFQKRNTTKVRFHIGEHKCGTLCLAKTKSILKKNPSVDVKSSLLLPF